jgi:predicted O-methyltransferase YrrM
MINFTLFFNFIKHNWNAKTRHGVHSPFVYQLIDEVIYDFKQKTAYHSIEKARKNLLHDNRLIKITDLGAGSHVNNQKQKQVKVLAKNALKSKKLAQLLYRLAKNYQPTTIIELGTCLGITTAYFGKAAAEAKLYTLEGCPQTAKLAKENLDKLGCSHVEIIVGNFDDTFPEFIHKQEQLDFIFIDGNHRKEATINYFNWCLPKVHEKSVIIFDDIYWSRGMKEAWEEIKMHPRVNVTIDLFWIGLVFFKTDQAKENFKVRF